jgi:ribose-phosphate pyrophosphokinase
MFNGLKLFSGRSNRGLAEEIASSLKISLGNILITDFSDGEIYVQIQENVRGEDVFLVQSTCSPGNSHLMELLIMIDAFRRASAERITAVIPYYGYARQDRKVQPRVPITAKLVANLLTAVGTDRVLAMELHAGQIQGFFDIPVDHLFATPVLIDYILSKKMENIIVVSPDAGGVERARAFAKRLDTSLGIIDKRREAKNISKVMNIIGDVKGKNVILVDDMVDTAGTLTESIHALKDNGALNIYACCTHPVLSGPAVERINNSPLKELIVTNTIPLSHKVKSDKIKILSVAPLLGEAISRIHQGASVSSLFI